MKRAEYLAEIERRANAKGYLDEEFMRQNLDVRVSMDAVLLAKSKGLQARDKRYSDSGYYIAADRVNEARRRVARVINCGDRLDTPESQLLVDEMHAAQDAAREILARMEIEDASI